MIERRRVPWSLWVYSAIVVLGTMLIEIQAHGPIPAKALYPVVIFAWLYFLLKGVRWVWIVTVGIYALGLVPETISGSLTWQGIALSLIGLTLLLLPVTRRYFSSQAAAARRLTRVPCEPASRSGGEPVGRLKSARRSVRGLAVDVLFRLAQWDRESTTGPVPKQRGYGVLMWRLGAACVLLFVLVGITYEWQQSSGHSLIANVVARVTWDLYFLAQLGFLVALVFAIRHRFSKSQMPSGSTSE